MMAIKFYFLEIRSLRHLLHFVVRQLDQKWKKTFFVFFQRFVGVEDEMKVNLVYVSFCSMVVRISFQNHFLSLLRAIEHERAGRNGHAWTPEIGAMLFFQIFSHRKQRPESSGRFPSLVRI